MTNPLPTVDWLHVCDHAFRDEQGKLCLIGLFDTLASQQLPGRLPMLSVAVGLSDGTGNYEIGLQVTAPSGKAVNMQLPTVTLADRRAKARAVIRLNGMPFEEFGTYTFRLILDGAPIEWPCHQLEHSQIQAPANGPNLDALPPAPGSFSN